MFTSDNAPFRSPRSTQLVENQGNLAALVALFLFLATVYLRPGEIVPAWQGLPIAMVVMPICIAISAATFVFRGPFAVTSMDLYVCAFSVVAGLSLVWHGWTGGLFLVAQKLGPSLVGYGLTRSALRSERALRRSAQILVVLSAFLAANGLLQYYTGSGLGDVQALTVQDTLQEPLDKDDVPLQSETRIRGTGIFNDPNDLAFVLAMATPLNLMLLWERRGVLMRLIYCTMLATSMTAVTLTRSRGGLIALLVSVTFMIRRRFGWKSALAVAAVGCLAFTGVAVGRLGTFDPTEASAQGRIEAWSVGLQLLKANPLVGVGFGAFTDFNELVAHNSYLNVLAELGAIGGYLFIAVVCLFLYSFRKDMENSWRPWYDAWFASGIATLLSCVFISRQYTVPLFVVFGVGASIAGMRALSRPALAEAKFLVATVAVIVTSYAAVLLLKAW